MPVHRVIKVIWQALLCIHRTVKSSSYAAQELPTHCLEGLPVPELGIPFTICSRSRRGTFQALLMLFSVAEWQCLGLWGSAREPSGGVEERLGLMVIALACEHAGGRTGTASHSLAWTEVS
ncbi:uncharacterized [Tachysurus ichikawai]